MPSGRSIFKVDSRTSNIGYTGVGNILDVVYAVKREGFRRRLSSRTITSYVYWIKKFFRFTKKDHFEITKKDIKTFIEHLSDRNLSGNTLNVALNSVKFLVEWVLNKRWKLNIRYSKTPKKLPVVLNREEIISLLNVIKNRKHRLIVAMMYASGLRVSEVASLRVRDLDLENSYGWVRHGKGDKDRIFIIAENLKDELKDWIKHLDPDSYMFKGRNGNLSTQSIQKIVKKAGNESDIGKNIHPHTLRHCFGTHIIENKYSLQTLQGLLGHNSPETSMVYVHTACPKMIKVISPYDDLSNIAKEKPISLKNR